MPPGLPAADCVRYRRNAQEDLIQASGTNWTIAMPVGPNENETMGTLAVTYDHTPDPFQMSRKLLAKFFIDNLYSETYIDRTPMLILPGKEHI
jgi:hypothetical protein